MSFQAVAWAQMLAPTPTDPNGKPSAPCAAVLTGLAQHAHADGADAFPSVELLMIYTRLAERTVRKCLDRLEASGVIVRSTSGLVERMIPRADKRPVSYDLQLDQVRLDLSDEMLLKILDRFPFLEDAIYGVHQVHPVEANGVHLTAESASRGASGAERGAPGAPKPSLNPVTSSFRRSNRQSGRQEAPARPSKLQPDLDAATAWEYARQHHGDDDAQRFIGLLANPTLTPRKRLSEWRSFGRGPGGHEEQRLWQLQQRSRITIEANGLVMNPDL